MFTYAFCSSGVPATAMFIMFAISQIASVRFSQLGSKMRIT